MKTLLSNLACLLSFSICATACIVDLDYQAPGVDGRLVYSPEPMLAADTQVALDSLSAATGLQFNALPGIGTRIRSATLAELTQCGMEKGVEVCAAACAQAVVTHDEKRVRKVEIRVDMSGRAECMDLAPTIQHEIIHSIRRVVDLGADGHTKTGVFQPVANSYDSKLDEASLVAVCEAIDCTEFNPEK